jgi:aminopeptidase N
MKLFSILFILIFLSGYTFSQKQSSEIVDVLEYTISLDFTDAENKNLKGNTNVRMKPVNDNVNNVRLELLNLTIDSITCDIREISYIYDSPVIDINLSESVSANDELNIKVYYHGSPTIDRSGFGGFYFSGEYAFNMGVAISGIPHNYGKSWFPCNDNFIDRASYHFFIKTKNEHTAICNGELINIDEDQETQARTYEWKLNEFIPTYLAAIAVGPYVSYDTIYQGIEKDIPVSIYVYPNNELKAERSFVNINAAMSAYELKFGAYKWNRVGFVAVPFRGGAMEHATNISIAAPSIDGTLNYEYLFYHELSHLWFGDLITCSTAEDMWMNEGWASYCETLFFEYVYNKEKALDYRRAAHLSVIKDCNVVDGDFHALYPMDLTLTYSTTVYDKGASTVHALRGYLGDEVFFDVIKDFLEQNAFSDVSSYDLRDFINSNTNIDVTDFFDDWVFTGGFVHYSIDSTLIRQNGNEYDVTVFVRQKLRGRDKFANSNRVEISFLDSDFNAATKVMEFDGEFGKQTFSITFEPILVLCDYNEAISDATTDLTKIISTVGYRNYADTYFKVNVLSADENNPSLLRVTHNFVAPDKFKTEIPGLIIADNRYWTIEGQFSQGFNAKAEFYFDGSQSSNLDNNFINNSLDSLVLLYRENRATDWQIEDSKISKISKRLTVDSLKTGEYSLAIYNWNQYVSIHNSRLSQKIYVYPNPNNGNFYVRLCNDFNGNIYIFNISGQKVFEQNIKSGFGEIEIKTNNFTGGTYIIEISDMINNNLLREKIIIQN